MEFFKKSNIIAFAIILAIAILMHPSLFKANDDTVDIPVSVTWDHGDNPSVKQPSEIKVDLKVNDSVIKTLLLTEDNDWKGTFEKVPRRDSKGNIIDYKIEATTVGEYKTEVTSQPQVSGLEISSWSEKIIPASNPTYDMGNASILLANKGGHYYIWSLSKLNDTQRSEVMGAINEAEFEGLGKGLTSKNTEFFSGSSATIHSDKKDEIRIEVVDGKRQITFEDPHVWSLFWTGNLSILETKEAAVKGTFTGTVTSENLDYPNTPDKNSTLGNNSTSDSILGTSTETDTTPTTYSKIEQSEEQLDDVPTTGESDFTDSSLSILLGAIVGIMSTGYIWRKQPIT